MSKAVLILTGLLCLQFVSAQGQELPPITEQQLEDLANLEELEPEDDQMLQQLQYYREHPLNLNAATAEELRAFRILTDLQIKNLLQYRRVVGALISIYELQAVPTWDAALIQKLVPYITVAAVPTLRETMRARLRQGEHTVLLRSSRVLEQKRGYREEGGSRYPGSPDHLLVRYQYQYKNLLHAGVTGDKDAGEPLFRGAQRKGFDFYSFHLFAGRLGAVKALALGDFAVNLGQGLIQWQSLAFKKSAEVVGTKRQSAVLQPYRSAGEVYFFRGAGVTVEKGRLEATAFASFRKVDGNRVADTLSGEEVFSSFQTSGYHRTEAEMADRHSVEQTSFGGNVAFRGIQFSAGVNAVFHRLSKPLQKRAEPYNYHAIGGRQWSNYSVDYSWTYKNIHLFGEAAADQRQHTALVQGALISVDPKVDVSLHYRHIGAAYQALYGNAFTEHTAPSNERGFYAGVRIRPRPTVHIDAFADFYRFPWIQYRVDAPGNGRDYLVQVTYRPNKEVELYARYRNDQKSLNENGSDSVFHYPVNRPKHNWRLHLGYVLTKQVELRARAEAVWYDRKGSASEEGYLTYVEGIYRPLRGLTANVRLQYFETEGFNSRVYSYERDVLYGYSIPFFTDTGLRYYANVHYAVSKKVGVWVRWAQTVYRDQEVIGSGLEEIEGRRKSEVRLQVRVVM